MTPPQAPDPIWLVLTTFEDEAAARSVAATLVGERLAACVTIAPPAHSTYHWDGAIQTATEVTVTIKTTSAAYPALENRLNALHPYETPEIVAIEACAALDGYADWVRGSVAPQNSKA